MALPCECQAIVRAANSGGYARSGMMTQKAWECPRCHLIYAVPEAFRSDMIMARPMARRDLLPWTIGSGRSDQKSRVPGGIEGDLKTIVVADTDGEIYAAVSWRDAPEGEREAIAADILDRLANQPD